MITTNQIFNLYAYYLSERNKYNDVKDKSQGMHDNVQFLIYDALSDMLFKLYSYSQENDGH